VGARSKLVRLFPESWLIMQDNYNFWHVRQTVNLEVIEKIELKVA